MKVAPRSEYNIFEVHICTDCALWFNNRDDSGSADDWRGRFESGWDHWENEFATPIVAIADGEPEFRPGNCDVCDAGHGNQYTATITGVDSNE